LSHRLRGNLLKIWTPRLVLVDRKDLSLLHEVDNTFTTKAEAAGMKGILITNIM
jgi:hypothetical protein